MFEAELSGKLPELAGYEDYLTSCVFGALKYLPPSAGLLPLLQVATNYRLGISLGSYLEQKSIQLADLDEAQFLFWPRSPDYGEPDLVVILQGTSGSFIVPIEVKLFSEKHGEGEEDQLARYYTALATDEGRSTFRCEAIRQFSGEFLALIYLTQFPAQREIEESLTALESRGIRESPARIFHVKWQQMHAVIEGLSFGERDPFRRKVLLDIKRLMEHRGLMPFRGFSRPSPELSTTALRRFPVFFEAEGIRAMRFDRFPALPNSLSAAALSRRPVFLGAHDQLG